MRCLAKILFLSSCMISSLQASGPAAASASAAPSQPATKDGGFMDKSTPITSILRIAVLRNVFDENTWMTMGQASTFPLKMTYSKDEQAKVTRGFSKDKQGKIKGNIVFTSQGKVKTPQDMLDVFKLSPVDFAFFAGSVVPMDKLEKLAFGAEKEAENGLTQYFAQYPVLTDPHHIYVLEGSDFTQHYSCLRKIEQSAASSSDQKK